MNAFPPIVVILSAYNCAPTLGAALDSMKKQSYENWLLLAADDGSSDDTPQILTAAGQQDPRIRVFIHQDNKGIAARLNELIDKALEEYPGSLIARMDGDDICDPARFEKQAAYMAAHREVGVLASWGRCITPDGQSASQTVETATDHDQLAVNGFFSAPLLHPSVIMRPSVLKTAGMPLYDSSLRRAQDFDLWARLIHQTRFAVMPEYLLVYRLGSDKKFDKESALNVYRRVIVDRNLQRLGLEGQDDTWKAATYALVGFPLPKTRVTAAALEQAMKDILMANAQKGLYNPALFQEKLEGKYRKAIRKTRWWQIF
ncbi:MAG: glycosyltransferase family 2 protein [Alphaproteobacteria bacterium]|nr:glycosyltransferase family 2 protein [Alphaproteobacteria bacterium]MCD8526373.1 glycosyltransferase family 2 protein [Alphaproteobacteria bacterium]MCD8571592.1 glycosyltransferase family 2 protein [Alphaproteobacteria bacterium]